jgi:hypothetical protein
MNSFRFENWQDFLRYVRARYSLAYGYREETAIKRLEDLFNIKGYLQKEQRLLRVLRQLGIVFETDTFKVLGRDNQVIHIYKPLKSQDGFKCFVEPSYDRVGKSSKSLVGRLTTEQTQRTSSPNSSPSVKGLLYNQQLKEGLDVIEKTCKKLGLE